MPARIKTGKIAFKPRARLLKLIGEELISDDIVAVSELVKNAHDADASTVRIVFQGVTSPGGEITIQDDGLGMDASTFLGRWMEPAASTKTRKGRFVTPKGRRTLGEKGVGRFAADKLGRYLEIVSRCPRSREEISARVDWDMFSDENLMLDQVESAWEVRPARIIRKHGTALRIMELRSVWNERMFRRLSIRLGRLLSPFRDRDNFSIRIESDEFPDYTGELRSDILDRAPYRIEASFDGAQTITVGSGWNAVYQKWNGDGELSCGPIRLHLYVYDLDAESLARIGPRMEVRAWLKEWTGISIYRDGFRIWPYGEPHDDWLRLDQRRVNNPVDHLSNNQVIGFIDITRDGNPQLMDQTNREGLMHNKALLDLRRLVYFVIQIVESQRRSLRHPDRHHPTSRNGRHQASSAIAEQLSELAESTNGRAGRLLKQVRKRLDQQHRLDQAHHEQLLDGYCGLAALGQLAAGMIESMRNDVKGLMSTICPSPPGSSRTNGSNGSDSSCAVRAAAERLSDCLQILHAASQNQKRSATIDLAAETLSFRANVESMLAARNIRMQVDSERQGIFRTAMMREHYHCLLHILTANSLDWLMQVEERRIRISISGDDDNCNLIYSDTGPGVPWQFMRRVFEPNFTTREGGRGMGLAIAERLVTLSGGDISLIVDGRRRGANFQVSLPRKRSRATF